MPADLDRLRFALSRQLEGCPKESVEVRVQLGDDEEWTLVPPVGPQRRRARSMDTSSRWTEQFGGAKKPKWKGARPIKPGSWEERPRWKKAAAVARSRSATPQPSNSAAEESIRIARGRSKTQSGSEADASVGESTAHSVLSEHSIPAFTPPTARSVRSEHTIRSHTPTIRTGRSLLSTSMHTVRTGSVSPQLCTARGRSATSGGGLQSEYTARSAAVSPVRSSTTPLFSASRPARPQVTVPLDRRLSFSAVPVTTPRLSNQTVESLNEVPLITTQSFFGPQAVEAEAPLYEQTSQLTITAAVGGVPLISEQQLRVRTRLPDARIEVIEVWQDGALIFRQPTATSTPIPGRHAA